MSDDDASPRGEPTHPDDDIAIMAASCVQRSASLLAELVASARLALPLLRSALSATADVVAAYVSSALMHGAAFLDGPPAAPPAPPAALSPYAYAAPQSTPDNGASTGLALFQRQQQQQQRRTQFRLGRHNVKRRAAHDPTPEFDASGALVPQPVLPPPPPPRPPDRRWRGGRT